MILSANSDKLYRLYRETFRIKNGRSGPYCSLACSSTILNRIPKHGTANEYRRYGCRCQLCKNAIAKEARLRRNMKKKYQRILDELAAGNSCDMRVSGNSMTPLIKSGSILTFKAIGDYRIGDVVMSKVKGRIIDAHKITQIDGKGRYLISNNHGHNNGWTKKIFGRVVAVNGKKFGRKIKT